ncbi:MAG: DedA family protein [Pseudorhodobacter sp.]
MPDTDTVIAFLSMHGHWIPVIVALCAAAETTIFLSIFVPSTVILVGVGGLVAAGVVGFWPVWLAAFLGAILGASLSWWIGHHYGDDIMNFKPLRRNPELVDRVRHTFNKWGDAAIVIGHFLGPLRAIMPVFSGFSGMSYARFGLFNLIGALAWAYIIPKSGELGGNALAWIWQTLGL